mgnify:CR=1 FL=1
MFPTAAMYNLPPMGLKTMGEEVKPEKKPMGKHPAFIVLAIVVAVVLLAMSGRYLYLRVKV